jgi:hypothetical protein
MHHDARQSAEPEPEFWLKAGDLELKIWRAGLKARLSGFSRH